MVLAAECELIKLNQANNSKENKSVQTAATVVIFC